MTDARDLERPAADYAAGDLDPTEREAFERQLADDPALADDVAFWQRMGPALGEHGRDPDTRLPGPGMVDVVRRRAAEQEELGRATGPQRLNLLTYLGWAAAAAATVLLAITMLDQPEPEPANGVTLAYAEDGSAQVLPQSVAEMILASHRPQAEPLAVDRAPTRSERPWMGVWTQPIELKGFERSKGLQVTRVAMGSPAFVAGLAPGDILLDLADCPMGTRYCISHAVEKANLKPGDPVQVRFWQRASGEVMERSLTLGCCLE